MDIIRFRSYEDATEHRSAHGGRSLGRWWYAMSITPSEMNHHNDNRRATEALRSIYSIHSKHYDGRESADKALRDIYSCVVWALETDHPPKAAKTSSK